MKVLVADSIEASAREALAAIGCEVIGEPSIAAEELPAAVAKLDPAVIIVRSKKVRKDAIDAGRSLKMVIRAGAGYDNIDCPAATARGVAVCNCPGMNAAAVAELAMGLLLACDRRIPDQVAELRAGRWDKKGFGRASGLKGRTLGVVGVGAIGEAVASRALAFEMNVVAWSRQMTPERAGRIGAASGGNDRAALVAMARRCDAVSVHVAGGPETAGLCDGEFFAAMKPGAIFINTSRGSVVDEAALADAVQTKGIRAGLDVHRDQPATPTAEGVSCPLCELPGVYVTHHCGASTDQAQEAVAEEVVRIVREFRSGGKIINRVN